jgi:hypothetical protein
VVGEGLKVFRGRKETQEISDRRVSRVYRESKVYRECRARKVMRATLVHRDYRESKVYRESRARKVTRVTLVHREPQGPQAHRECRGLLDWATAPCRLPYCAGMRPFRQAIPSLWELVPMP